mmetsp:Transcript_900/g.2657  ORF Transcript_900/g.2657 Transcript_900/m.2657 type:complete len:256 (+) Transcript_900:2436-3203(+)
MRNHHRNNRGLPSGELVLANLEHSLQDVEVNQFHEFGDQQPLVRAAEQEAGVRASPDVIVDLVAPVQEDKTHLVEEAHVPQGVLEHPSPPRRCHLLPLSTSIAFFGVLPGFQNLPVNHQVDENIKSPLLYLHRVIQEHLLHEDAEYDKRLLRVLLVHVDHVGQGKLNAGSELRHSLRLASQEVTEQAALLPLGNARDFLGVAQKGKVAPCPFVRKDLVRTASPPRVVRVCPELTQSAVGIVPGPSALEAPATPVL